MKIALRYLTLFSFVLAFASSGCRRKHGDTPDASPPPEPSSAVTVAPVDAEPLTPGHGRFSNPPAKDGPTFPSAYDTTEDIEDGLATRPPVAIATGKKLGATQGNFDDRLSETTGTTFQFTYYHISLRPNGDPNEVQLRDCQGNLMTWASRSWRADAIMEGTARFNVNGESKSMNIADGAGSCWLPLDWESRWGLGVWNNDTQSSYKLRPFRSIAIDRRELVMGAWYYVKELDGVQMPYPVSTMKHDGCVRAMDVGTAIIGKHIDFYAAYATAYQSLVGTPGTPLYHRYNVTMLSGRTKCKTHIDRGY